MERAAKSNRITVNRTTRSRLRQDMAVQSGGAKQMERAARPAKPHIVLRGGDIRKALRYGSWRGLRAHAFSLGNAAVKEELTWRT